MSSKQTKQTKSSKQTELVYPESKKRTAEQIEKSSAKRARFALTVLRRKNKKEYDELFQRMCLVCKVTIIYDRIPMKMTIRNPRGGMMSRFPKDTFESLYKEGAPLSSWLYSTNWVNNVLVTCPKIRRFIDASNAIRVAGKFLRCKDLSRMLAGMLVV